MLTTTFTTELGTHDDIKLQAVSVQDENSKQVLVHSLKITYKGRHITQRGGQQVCIGSIDRLRAHNNYAYGINDRIEQVLEIIKQHVLKIEPETAN